MAKKLSLDVGPARHEIDLIDRPDGGFTMIVNDVARDVDLQQVGKSNLHRLIIDGVTQDVVIWRESTGLSVAIGPATHTVTISRAGVHNPGGGPLSQEGEVSIDAPMAGQIVELLVAEGDTIKVNAPLIVIAAMKMNNEIRSPVDATVRAIRVAPGDAVDSGTPLILLETLDT